MPSCYRLSLGGLTGEELWEYCNAIVRDLGLTLDRSDETYAKILDKLCGNPLAIRSILLQLQDCSARQLLADLESSFEGMEGDESTRRLQAAYTVFGSSLVERYLPVLQVTGLHEFHANADDVKTMLDAAGCPVEQDRVNACYRILGNAGFCTHIGQNVYQLHPALRGYLLRQTPAPESVQRGFVNIMGSLADALPRKPLYQVKTVYQMNVANLYYARRLAEIWDMDIKYMALTLSLAYYAEEMRRFAEANKLYLALAEKAESSNHWEVVAGTYHQLGIIAQAQRDYAAAEAWYKKSLEIKEKQGNEQGAANTYHQLGRIAEEQRDYATAEGWYKKSLVINEKQGNEQGAANTYHQLGIIAGEQRDYAAAEGWYKKSLVIDEKQGNEHGAASTYHQLGRIAEARRDFPQAGDFYLRSIKILADTNDPHSLKIAIRSYARLLHTTAGTEHSQLRQAWSTYMPQELTKILEEMEVELNDANS